MNAKLQFENYVYSRLGYIFPLLLIAECSVLFCVFS
jgi:hypothetical protein